MSRSTARSSSLRPLVALVLLVAAAMPLVGLSPVLPWWHETPPAAPPHEPESGAELVYAFRGRTPENLGDARSLFARGVPLADNSYVELSGQPDRRNALFIEPRGEKSRQTFFRLLGTDSRVLVRAADTSNRADLQDHWTGRLRRFDALNYAPQMRAYFQNEVRAARYLSPAALKEVERAVC